MNKYFLSQAGRELCPLDGAKKECLSQVREIAKQELTRARARFGKAWIHKMSDVSWIITLGESRNSQCWTSVSLVEGK